MQRRIRTTVIAAAAATAGLLAAPVSAHAARGDTVYVDGVAYEDLGVVQLGDGDGDGGGDDVNADELLDSVFDVAKPVSCVPKTATTRIYDPSARVYYGALDSIYVWEGLGEAEITGCPDNVVTVRVRMRDQALNGTSFPAEGEDAVASGKARAGAIAQLMQRYSNVAMSTGLSLHTITTTVTASQTDGRTTTAWCTTKSWTYVATLAGPQFVGETPTEKIKCGTVR